MVIGLATAVGVLIGGKLNFTDTSDRLFTSNSKKDKLNRLIDYIDYEYVDNVNTDSIVDVTVNGILEKLDPHSVYIPKRDMQGVAENMKGDFVGIGISFYTYKDTIAVIRSLKGGPSEKAGIRGGDRIIMADGDSIYGSQWTNQDLIQKIKGEKNSRIQLKIYRKGEKDLLDFDIKRTTIPIKSVEAAYMLTSDLGYIKINRFAESTYKEFKSALNTLQGQGAKQLALDLRDNPGGFLTIAEQIADEFLEKGKLILYTKNKAGRVEKSFATRKGDFENGEVYILINENSASASEIVAGALQDNDKGTIIGRRSYGKGLVQREMALGDGSAVRLTVARYYTPTGRSIQRPYDLGHNEDYYNDYYKRRSSGEFNDEVNIKVSDSLKFTTPKGKIVYGGGGIIPDIFVPLNSSVQNETLNFVKRSGFISYFVFEELDKDRSRYNTLSEREFIENYEVNDTLVKRFEEYISIREHATITFVAYKEEMKQLIKAALADQLFGPSAAEEISNATDDMIKEVIKLSNAGK